MSSLVPSNWSLPRPSDLLSQRIRDAIRVTVYSWAVLLLYSSHAVLPILPMGNIAGVLVRLLVHMAGQVSVHYIVWIEAIGYTAELRRHKAASLLAFLCL